MAHPIDKIIEDNERMSEGGIETAIKYIQRDIADINDKLDDKYVTKDQFEPVRNIVYGLVTLMLVAVIVALLALVIKDSSQPLQKSVVSAASSLKM